MALAEQIPVLAYVADGLCRYAPASERKTLWESVVGPIPQGMMIGSKCHVDYCGKFEHMLLRPNGNYHKKNWKELRQRVESLEVGDYFDVPSYKGTVSELNTGVGMCTAAKFQVRSLPAGGVRIFRTGQWGTLGRPTQELSRLPLLISWSKFVTPPGTTFYLGFMSASSMHADVVPKRSHCGQKGCVFPVCAKGLCHRHLNFGLYAAAMKRARLSFEDYHPTPERPVPAMSAMRGYELEHSHERTLFIHRGQVNRGWKLSEDYWRNAVASAVAEAQVSEQGHVRVIREKPLRYMPEAAIPNTQGRGTRGGHAGNHKKIRKKQRMRGAGWSGKRPDHDVVKRWNREALDDVPIWTPADKPRFDPEDELEIFDDVEEFDEEMERDELIVDLLEEDAFSGIWE